MDSLESKKCERLKSFQHCLGLSSALSAGNHRSEKDEMLSLKIAPFRRDRLAVFVAFKSMLSPRHRRPAYRTTGITLLIGIETAPGHSPHG